MKKGDMIVEMGRCLKNVLFDDRRRSQCSTPTISGIPAERMVVPIKYLWFDRQQLVGRLRYLRLLWVMLGQYEAYSLIVSSL